MSQSLRQSDLFAGNDWTVLYQAFTDINFNASDPASINAALQAYLQQNYPENYNDWITSSEFVAIIDLLSWLAGTLAFRTDINARESFLDTAETRTAILRLARFISYNPQRNQEAQGILKLVGIKTTDNVYDSFGANLNNQTIVWDNPDDPNWFERFLLILNSSFISTNQFGVPLNSGLVASINTQLYRFNNVMSDANLAFSKSIGGTNMDFSVVNSDFIDGGSIVEREPNFSDALHVLYMNDGQGYSSSLTGFFMLFKQGTLQRATYNIPNPIENNIINVNATGVNNSDVWVQTVNDSGDILYSWTKVPAIFSQNITYNNIDPSIRDIFAVITGENDSIGIRFSDGLFGNVPTGNIRVFYRTSNGLQYQIQPTDIQNVNLSIPYYNRGGVKQTLTLTFSLEQTISNSAPAETDDQVKARAPSVYATQNRMVSGQDYNTFPLQSNLATKIKSTNRIYSGHSRFIDLNDPTGTYKDVVVFSDDGIFFQEKYNIYTQLPITLNASASNIITQYIQPMIDRVEVINYINSYLYTQIVSASGIIWTQASSNTSFSNTGYFSASPTYLRQGATVLFNTGSGPMWSTIVSIVGDPTIAPPAGTAGPVTLSRIIPSTSTIEYIIPSFFTVLDSITVAAITTNLTNNLSFTLWYDYSVYPSSVQSPWVVISSANPVSPTSTMFQIMAVQYSGAGTWTLSANGLRYVFESNNNVQWFYDGSRTTDQDTGVVANDLVRVLKVNEDLNNFVANTTTLTGVALSQNYDLDINRIYFNRNGSANPRRITVTFADSFLTGTSDYPDTFEKIISNSVAQNHLFWQHDDTYGDIPFPNMVYMFEEETDRVNTVVSVNTVGFQINSNNALLTNTFWLCTTANSTSSTWTLQGPGTYSYGIGRGSNVAGRWYAANTAPVVLQSPEAMMFQWKHYAPINQRIDPARTNINDIFVLTSSYDYLVRLWIAAGAIPSQMPTAPTELDLRLAFQDFEQYKIYSDQIVWRPVQYKFLFGPGADPELQAQFKVITVPTSTLSSGEITSQIVRAINNYFSVQYWDFGESFYFTELAAYVHQQLPNIIGSIVLVPTFSGASFGDLFEIQCRSDELFISTAQVSNIIIINSNTPNNLRIS
jgi:hypothetical protein